LAVLCSNDSVLNFIQTGGDVYNKLNIRKVPGQEPNKKQQQQQGEVAIVVCVTVSARDNVQCKAAAAPIVLERHWCCSVVNFGGDLLRFFR
jgi:hypothetical protein